MNIRTKIILYFLSLATLLFLVTTGYLMFSTNNEFKQIVRDYIEEKATSQAHAIESEMNTYIGFSRSLAQTMRTMKHSPDQQDFDYFTNIMKNIFIENQEFLSIWASWEYNFINKDYTDSHGKTQIIVHEFSGRLIVEQDTLNLESEDIQTPYYEAKISLQEYISLPYYYTFDSRIDEVLITKICIPVIKEGNFIGLTGVDLKLEVFNDIFNTYIDDDVFNIYLLSNEGEFIYHADEEKINRNISEIRPNFSEKNELTRRIHIGETFSASTSELNSGGSHYISFVPVSLGEDNKSWSLMLEADTDLIYIQLRNKFIIASFLALGSLIAFFIFTLLFGRDVSKPISKMTHYLKKIADGDITSTVTIKEAAKKSEIGQMSASVNKLLANFKKMIDFSNEIGKGNLDAKYELVSRHDALGQALLDMKQNLREADKEEKKRQEEDRRRNWITRGLAQLGDVLRQNRRDITEFSNNIISNFTKYVGANQGGLFIINDENENDVFIELVAAYAYDRERIFSKRINMGRGLIGRCILEKDIIHLNEIPEDYLHITSGLGEAPPRHLLLVPLIFDDVVYGVIEFGAFQPFEEYQIEFVERFSENVAAAISNIKINQKTEQLLEESKTKSEELAVQEADLRHNMQELQITQEESIKKEIEITGIIKALTSTASIVHFDIDGTIIELNLSDNLSSRYYTPEMVGKNHREFAVESVESPKEYNDFWEGLRIGKPKKRILHVDEIDDERWLYETYSPILNEEKKVYKVICIQQNITDTKHKEIEMESRISLLERQEKELRDKLHKMTLAFNEISGKSKE